MDAIPIDSVRIEVLAKEGDSSTRRGELLEGLAKRVLSALQFVYISTTVRRTGIEIDVVGQDPQTSERVIVECKAYRDQTIASDVVIKLFGQVNFYGYSAGWLLTTSELGKDAKGLRDEHRQKPEAERKKLRFYDPGELVGLFVSTGQVFDPKQLLTPPEIRFSRTATLLVSDIGEYWAVTAIGASSGVADTVFVFDGKSGQLVREKGVIQALSERDSDLKELTWIANDDGASAAAVLSDAALKRELDSIAAVPIADTWSDYRPARPQDFVGRDEVLRSILSFLDDVRIQKVATRLLAIKAPSGWGKSSFLNKLRATCANIRNRGRFFLYPVDCRTAISARYPELALKRCFDQAISEGFISLDPNSVSIGSAGDPLSAISMQTVLEYLHSEQKVVVLFFDQFEEITTREDFADLFQSIKAMCSAIDSARENVVLGFSWKTDGAIPTDHPAYHIWHQFGDRRREFELSLFSAAEISRLLGGLAKELTHAIDPSLKRLLSEQCQGYPWLLKKLCIHVFGVLRSSPTKQRELLERTLDIDALFKKDLEKLQSAELECVKRIAKDSPADFYTVENAFGAAVISKLTNQRLIVRNAGKLILYWDIFREYVLTGRAPKIPSRYVPVTGPGSGRELLGYLLGRTSTPLAALSRRFNLKLGTLDNISRDFVMMGIAQYNRKEQKVRLVPQSIAEMLSRLFTYASTHLVYKKLNERSSTSPTLSVGDAIEVLKASSAAEGYSDTTWRNTALRLLQWMRALGLIRWEQEDQFVLIPNPIPPRSLEQLLATKRQSGNFLFKADAPPLRVLEVLGSLIGPAYTISPEDRNSLYVLRSLGVVTSATDPSLIERPAKDMSAWLAARVIQTPTFRDAADRVKQNPDISPINIGQVIEDLGGQRLAASSKLRYGHGILVWLRWVDDLVRDRLTVKA